jgi:hypothetical protein
MSTDQKHLEWIYDRLIRVHNESPNVDHMLRFRGIIDGSGAALAAEPVGEGQGNCSGLPESRLRRFASLTRTPTPQGYIVLDAIDTDGRAWWLVSGDSSAPDDWTELEPLPTYEAHPEEKRMDSSAAPPAPELVSPPYKLPPATTQPAADQAEGPSLADVDWLCAEYGFHYDDNESLEILHNMITAATTWWRASVAEVPIEEVVRALNLPQAGEGEA